MRSMDQNKRFRFQSSYTSGKSSMENFVGGILPVVTDKNMFDYRNQTII